MIPETREELIAAIKSGASPESIDLSKLNRITLYEPDEMIVMCEPGIMLAALDETLQQNQQWIASLLPDEREDRTLDEALSKNAYHPRTRFGSPLATSVLGGTFVTRNGEVFKSGSRVVKSVAGYDTHRAFVGSEGKLFIPIEFTLKVMPRPKAVVRFIASLDSRAELLKHRPLVVEEWEDKLVVEFAGEPEDIVEDRVWLSDRKLIEREIVADWGNLMIEISRVRTNEINRAPIEPRASELLNQLKERINA